MSYRWRRTVSASARRVALVSNLLGVLTALSGLLAVVLTLLMVFTGFRGHTPMMTGAAALVFCTLALAARYFSEDVVRTRHARLAVAQTERTLIAESSGSVARVRGTVRVLQAVGEGPAIGALFRRTQTHFEHDYQVHTPGRVHDVTRTDTLVTDETWCGRMAIADDSGVAIVEGDGCIVWSLRRKAGRDASVVFAAREGMVVEVVGPVRHVESDEASLVFDPSRGPVWILV